MRVVEGEDLKVRVKVDVEVERLRRSGMLGRDVGGVRYGGLLFGREGVFEVVEGLGK